MEPDICLDKRNWLLIGHPDAGRRSALIYGLLINARQYRLDPAAWLNDVLLRIPTCRKGILSELLAIRLFESDLRR